MQKISRTLIFLIISIMFLLFTGCSSRDKLTILSGSENKELEPLLEQFSKKNNIDVEMVYKGSVDIMQELQRGDMEYDAVWPANSLWIAMGDNNHIVKHQKSIMTSPVVFGIKKSIAEELRFIGTQVSVKDILKAIEEKKLTFTMTSASQSNSGASAYIGFIYSLLENPEIVNKEDLHNPNLKKQITTLLSGINRSSGSSEWLKEMFLKGKYDAMVNYESLVISANQELIKEGREPLYIVYPYDGLAIADSPLGYINKDNNKKEENFKKLQEFLLSKSSQDELLKLGRRTGFGGSIEDADSKIFKEEWGIDKKKILSPIKMPSREVIQEALNLYQSEFKKPSFTIFCLDFSGSMDGDGEKQLKESMKMILDQKIAKQYFLQSTPEDVTVVIPFSDEIKGVWEVKGNDEKEMKKLIDNITNLKVEGGTDIYTPAIQGIEMLKSKNIEKYTPAIILMTDGESNVGKTFNNLKGIWQKSSMDIPIFSIMFGSASEKQLEDIAELTTSRVFDGKKDLIDAFKKVKGYN